MQMMHKIHTSRIGLWLAMIALLVMVVMPASANDVPTLSDLARYVPADYDVYGAVQIDDATIASVDGLVASVAQRFGEDAPPSVGMVRDMILSNLAPGYTWEDVKDWMAVISALRPPPKPLIPATSSSLKMNKIAPHCCSSP
jgi:hypothetical protein